jgi:hypothetical protein
LNGKEHVDFSKIKIGAQTLSDAIFTQTQTKKARPDMSDKRNIMQAIGNLDYPKMIEVSDYYFRTNGIYSRLCKYAARMYRYDWYITPYINEEINETKQNKCLQKFDEALKYFDAFEIKKTFGDIALKVVRRGSYYGYLILNKNRPMIQELPSYYCRSRFCGPDGRPVVEFNMKYFDDQFRDEEQRKRMLNLFPPEFKKGYMLYIKGKLPPMFQGDTKGWYMLDPDFGIKININNEDTPLFMSVIPALIDLEDTQALARKKQEQELLKILVQKFPLDKNYNLVFDTDEMADLHRAAVNMIGQAVGIDVLTTVADISVEDMAEAKTSADSDDVAKAERAVFNAAGVSQMQFNTDGNIALEKSILNDEAALLDLVLQFEALLNNILDLKYNGSAKQYSFRASILPTTIYNYKDISKQYKEMTQLGYSKMLPQIALGQSQSSILATAYFENDVLNLVERLVPPMSSNTMNAQSLKEETSSKKTNSATKTDDEKKGGRPTNEEQGKATSEKRMQNQESES